MHSTDSSTETDPYETSRYRYRYRRQWDDEAVLDDDVVQTTSSPIVETSPSPEATENLSNAAVEPEEPDEQVTIACVRLRPRSVRNCTSVTLNVNPASPIAEEETIDADDDADTRSDVTQSIGCNGKGSRSPSACSSSFYLRKSDTVFELQPADRDDTDDSRRISATSSILSGNNGAAASSVSINESENSRDAAEDEDEEEQEDNDDAEESSSVSFSLSLRPRSSRPESPPVDQTTEVRLRLRCGSRSINRDSSDISNADPPTDSSSPSVVDPPTSDHFIGQYKDIDEMLGNLFRMIEDANQTLDEEYSGFQEVHASAVKVHDNRALVAKVSLRLPFVERFIEKINFNVSRQVLAT